MTLILDPDDPAGWREAPSAAVRPPASVDRLTDGLNPQQREAVEYRGPALLIVAGAGSGKTRVLTHRIAGLIESREAWPSQILAITFTNKAAAEMRERVEALLGESASRHVDLHVPLGVRAHPATRGRDDRPHVDASRSTTPPTAHGPEAHHQGARRRHARLHARQRRRRSPSSRTSSPTSSRYARNAEHERPAGGDVPRDLPAVHPPAARGERPRLRRPHRRDRLPVPRVPEGRGALPAAVPAHPRRRVPGHQPRAVLAHPRAHPAGAAPTASPRWSSTACTSQR